MIYSSPILVLMTLSYIHRLNDGYPYIMHLTPRTSLNSSDVCLSLLRAELRKGCCALFLIVTLIIIYCHYILFKLNPNNAPLSNKVLRVTNYIESKLKWMLYTAIYSSIGVVLYVWDQLHRTLHLLKTDSAKMDKYHNYGVSHVAIILDGNRRHGRNYTDSHNQVPVYEYTNKQLIEQFSRGLTIVDAKHSVALGHYKGAEKLKECIDWCLELSIPILTVYAFSTENWSRPKSEIQFIIDLLIHYIASILDIAKSKRLLLRFISTDPELMPSYLLELLLKAELETRCNASNCRLIINICISYSGKNEIANAFRYLNQQHTCTHKQGISHMICSTCIDNHLLRSLQELINDTYYKDIVLNALTALNITEQKDARLFNIIYIDPVRSHSCWSIYPDVILRTGGDKRLSNFLLYESAYSELFYLNTNWPSLTFKEFHNVLLDFLITRKRRFGK